MKISTLPQPQNLLLLAVLVILCCYTAVCSFAAITPVEEEYSVILLTKANYAGFLAVAACLLSYSAARPFFKRALGFTLLFSVFHLLNFLPTSFSMGLSFGELQVGIEPLCLLLLVGYYFLNRASANVFIRKYLLPAPTPEKAVQLHRESIDLFKQNFARKTDDSLRQIIQDRKLVADAITAAHELLHERRVALAKD